jgi:hypothetical protein
VKVNQRNSCCDRGQCDHLSCVLRVVCILKRRYASDLRLCFCDDERNCESLDSLRKFAAELKIKKRSPYVSRYYFVSGLLVPQNVATPQTNGSVNCDQVAKLDQSATFAVVPVVKELRRSELKTSCHAADVCKVF